MQQIIIKIPKRFGPFNWVKKIEGNYPTTWNELTRKKYVSIIKLLYSSKEVYSFRIQLVSIMLGLNKLSKALLTAAFSIAKFNKLDKYVDFYDIKTEAENNSAIMVVQLWWLFKWVKKDITLTKNLIPFIRTNFFGKKLYGPADGLASMTAEEWMWVDRFYLKWRTTENFKHLYQMTACLYRPKGELTIKNPKFNGDVRELFNVNRIDSWLVNIQDAVEKKGILRFFNKKITNKIELLAIMHWYESNRSLIAKEFDQVFSEGNETSAEGYGWPSIFMKIANDGPFGNLDKVNSENITTVLLHMQVRAIEAEKERIEREKKPI